MLFRFAMSYGSVVNHMWRRFKNVICKNVNDRSANYRNAKDKMMAEKRILHYPPLGKPRLNCRPNWPVPSHFLIILRKVWVW